MPKYKNNKKGFTLVELLAVTIILIILMTAAILSINRHMEQSRLNAFIEEANTFAKGGQQKYSSDRISGTIGEDLFHNKIKGKVCYSIEQQLVGKFVDKKGNKYTGSVEVCYGLDCTYSYKVWMSDGEHFIDGETNINDTSVIKDKYTTDHPLTCGVEALGGAGTGGDLKTAEFEYRSEEYVMTIVKDGVYALEGWGAQGGRQSIYRGGYGAYAYTEVELHVGDKLYINVGGRGEDASDSPVPAGGYNGGGNGNKTSNDREGANAGGGGSTTITTTSGFISKPILEDYLYLVAGGGGAGHVEGRWTEASRKGYSAGGYLDESSTVSQSNYNYGKASSNSGSGGGYHAFNGNAYHVGRGGTSFIGNPLTRNGVMYGYNAPTNSSAYTKTVATTDISLTPVPKYAKMGDGFARITYIGTYTETTED